MNYKKTINLLILASCSIAQGFEGDSKYQIVKTIALPIPSVSSITLRTKQPRPEDLTQYDALACATTTCGCAACCCAGPITTPIACELVRTGILFAIAAFASRKEKTAITISTPASNHQHLSKK